MKPKLVIYWSRRDFRFVDNPALSQAVDFAKKNQIPLLPIFILDNFLLNSETNLDINSGKNDEKSDSDSQNNLPTISPKFHNIGLPRRLFLSRILASFSLKFESCGIFFGIFFGNFESVFQVLADNFELFIFANQDIEPFSQARDLAISRLLSKENFYSFADQLTISPNLRTGNGTIYSIFTPFKNAGWESFMNSKTFKKVEIEKEKSVFLDQNNQICNQIQSLFEQDANQISEQNPKNSQSLKSNKKTGKNIDKILIKKTNFQDLQTQIYNLIGTKWQFVINKHNQNNPNLESNSPKDSPEEKFEQNLQNSQDLYLEKLKNKSETRLQIDPEIDPEITENNDNFVINLENILTKPDYLEWSFEEELILSQFEDFLEKRIENYKENRDSLELDTVDSGATSKISVALKWGLVSSRTLKQKIVDKFGLQITSQSGVVHFLNELIWREFYRYILFHEPLVLDTEFQPRFRQKIEENELENLKEKLSEENIAKLLESLK